jgi:hypothetical protein
MFNQVNLYLNQLTIKPDMELMIRGNALSSKNSSSYDHDNNSNLLQLIAYTIIIASTILLSFSLMLLPVINQMSSSISLPPLQSAYGQTVPQSCNCIIDYTSSGHSNNNITGITIPGVKLLKNETYQSQTEGRLSSIVIKSTQLMGIRMKDFSLGNFSSGTGATVALNTINVRPNESLGIKISGGTIPSLGGLLGEIVKADVNVNGTLSQIKTVGNNTTQFPLHYNKGIKQSVFGINKFLVNIKEPGYYLLLISLGYNTKTNNNNINANSAVTNDKFIGNEQTRYPLIAVYETVLKVG